MKYPTHSILDLQTTYLSKFLSSSSKNTSIIKQQFKVISKTTYYFLSFSTLSDSKTLDNTKKFQPTSYNLYTICDISFLRKEKIYTKLKYSRCPQYDIISGGFAALFAGFIGFLISEKFGIELVDSGDFYIAFMYGIFIVFSVRPFLKIYSLTHTPYTP